MNFVLIMEFLKQIMKQNILYVNVKKNMLMSQEKNIKNILMGILFNAHMRKKEDF